MTATDPLRITEAVPVAEARLTWIQMSDESTAEIDTGAVRTVGELIERLRHVPPDTPVATTGYEAGFARIGGLSVVEVQELDHGDAGSYLGPFEDRAEAERLASAEPMSLWLAVYGGTPPRLVGEPVHAVILHREGR